MIIESIIPVDAIERELEIVSAVFDAPLARATA